MNKRQQDFADEYIITGNKYQSALTAGYSENYAKSRSHELLEHVGIKEYIAKKTKELQIEKHLSMEEALALTASIAKGEPQKFLSREFDPITGEIIVEEIKEFSAGFKERNQALEHFYKINAAFIDKQEVTNTSPPTFVDDIGGVMSD